jgi:hypothetical protein
MVQINCELWVMVFNATLNNISVLLVGETGVPGDNHRPAASHWQTLSHNVDDLMLYRVHLAWVGFELIEILWNIFYSLAPQFVDSAKCIKPWVLEFVVSNITGNNQ